MPFNIQEEENNFIHDLNLASTDNETAAVKKNFYTTDPTLKYRFNNDNGDNGAAFFMADNAGNQIKVIFSFHGHWDKDRDYMGLTSVYPYTTKQAEVVA